MRNVLLDLSLNKEEPKTLIEFLSSATISLTENLHFVYLLQRNDFVNAESLIDKLMKSTRDRTYDLNVPRDIDDLSHNSRTNIRTIDLFGVLASRQVSVEKV